MVVVNFLNKRNEADQRVYAILKEKFKLFDGVFGASDEVLGAIETGVDFEKRIAQIYQNCRTSEEIQNSFNELQKQMEQQIDDVLKSTRNKLLENFDEEVHEKLRIRLAESREYLNKFEKWLWNITKYYLKNNAVFSETELSFMLTSNPFPSETIHPGPYKLAKNVKDANTYRIGHPLAQRILKECSTVDLELCKLDFIYTGTPPITIIEPLIGKCGWLIINNLTISSFEIEDHVLVAGTADDGTVLEDDQCRRLFSLGADISKKNGSISKDFKGKLEKLIQSEQTEILKINSSNNAQYFEDELTKLDKWAEDKKASLEIQLKELDKEIKFMKTEARKIQVLEDKIEAQKNIKEKEANRNKLRYSLFSEQDNIDKHKEKLIDEMEKRLKQEIDLKPVMLFRWELKR